MCEKKGDMCAQERGVCECTRERKRTMVHEPYANESCRCRRIACIVCAMSKGGVKQEKKTEIIDEIRIGVNSSSCSRDGPKQAAKNDKAIDVENSLGLIRI